MNALRTIMLAIDGLVVSALGLLAVAGVLNPPWTLDIVTRLATPMALLVVGISALVLHGVYVSAELVHRSETRRYIPVNNERGAIHIALGALEESLERSLKTLREVAEVRVRVRVPSSTRSKDRIRVQAFGALWEDLVDSNTTLRAQQLLRERFLDIVEVEPEPIFEITWTHIRPRRPSKKKRVKEKVTDTVFRGPQYPIRD